MVRVNIFGAGIAGLTVAHELACRGQHEITVYDPRSSPGGKARSQMFDRVASGGRSIPGEHGFRFFAGWYLHLTELLSRIPQHPLQTTFRGARIGYSVPTVVNRLVEIRDTLTWAKDRLPVRVRHCARKVRDFGAFKKALAGLVPDASMAEGVDIVGMFFDEIRAFFMTEPADRHERFDHESLAQYVGVEDLSDELKKALRRVPRALVAMDGYQGSAVTFLNTLMLNLAAQWDETLPFDRVLDGPTSKVWIDPWVSSLKQLGVHFVSSDDARLTRLEVDGLRVVSAKLSNGKSVEGDEFVIAVPFECLQRILRSSELGSLSPEFQELDQMDTRGHRGWMVGMQVALRRPINSLPGHIYWVDSPYGVTGISQMEVWAQEHRKALKRQGVEGLLSLIVTQWENDSDPKDPYRSPSELGSKDELVQNTLRQLQSYPSEDGKPLFSLDDVIATHVDNDLHDDLQNSSSHMFIHPPGSWSKRPTAETAFENLSLAGEFVRNPADLATMEGACASAKIAANSILWRTTGESDVRVHDLVSELEPPLMKRMRHVARRFRFTRPRESRV